MSLPQVLRPLLQLGIAWILSGLAACRPAQDSAPELPVLKLGYFANLSHAQAVLGVQSGAFAQALAPCRLETKIFNAGPSLIEALNAGEIDVGYVGPGPALNAWIKSKGQGLRVISGAAANGVVLVVSSQSGITRLEQLKGCRLATPQLGNTQDIAARHFLKFELKQDRLDNILPIPNAEQLKMMERGQIDAAWSPEPWATRLVQEAGGKVLCQEKDLWTAKEFSLTVVITRPEFLAAHPKEIAALLKQHTRLTTELNSQPEKLSPALAAEISRLSGKTIPEKLVGEALKRVKFTNDPMPESLKIQAEHAFQLGLYKEAGELKGLVDTRLLSAP
ncbi:MAG: hypothetical protein RL095_343 [Verrucomicrobiota bacterium]|jgi:NitT/TauT family transport system substrate-binding protein